MLINLFEKPLVVQSKHSTIQTNYSGQEDLSNSISLGNPVRSETVNGAVGAQVGAQLVNEPYYGGYFNNIRAEALQLIKPGVKYRLVLTEIEETEQE